MSTQIYIQPPSSGTAGCQPEFTKIASHSFIFEPSGLPISGGEIAKTVLHTGGFLSIADYAYPAWSADVRNYQTIYAAGALTGTIKADEGAIGIPLPINLVADDVVTISGNIYCNNISTYIGAGYDVNLVFGVYYFDCTKTVAEGSRIFTFVPVSTIPFTDDRVCFDASVTLSSSFDIHETRLIVGYNIFATCPPGDEVCVPPFVDLNVATASYTLDIQRPCKAQITNYIIKNCCEGSITELVNIPGLVVGDFHVDDEGNCWEVMSESTDVTNFTRNFVDTYASCAECQAANPCPLNLVIQSCCVDGIEFVTGSLPGLNVGDTFVDNYGLCWYVAEEGPIPISEESITVGSIITGDCETCKTENPCPNFYGISSCCASIEGYIAVPDILNLGDSFVDAQGQCWNVFETDAGILPTIYGVEVVTVYTSTELDTCTDCITANPCPTEYFITIKSCCDQDRVEVAQVPADYMFFTEGTIFNDYWGLCWEVISFNTTGTATFEIWPFVGGPKPEFGQYKECKDCIKKYRCSNIYSLRDCQTDIVYNPVRVILRRPVAIGDFFSGGIEGVVEASCFEILDYGYPTYPAGTYKGSAKNGPNATCEECQLVLETTKILEFSQCCGGPNIIVEYTGSWVMGFGGTAMIPLTAFPSEGPYTPTCITLVGYSTGIPVLYNQPGISANYSDCVICLNDYPCP